MCPSGQGDGLEIHRALPAGVRIPSLSVYIILVVVVVDVVVVVVGGGGGGGGLVVAVVVLMPWSWSDGGNVAPMIWPDRFGHGRNTRSQTSNPGGFLHLSCTLYGCD